MVVAPLIIGRDLKISEQNNWGALRKKIKFGWELDLRGAMNPDDVMVVVLKDIPFLF